MEAIKRNRVGVGVGESGGIKETEVKVSQESKKVRRTGPTREGQEEVQRKPKNFLEVKWPQGTRKSTFPVCHRPQSEERSRGLRNQ